MNARNIGVLTACLLTGTTLGAASPNTMTTPRTDRTIDPATGAVVTTTSGAPGTAVFELTDGRVTIRKDVRLGRSITTIASGADRLLIAIDRTGVAVSAAAGEAAAEIRHPEEIGAVMRLIASSRAGKDAAGLLGRVQLDQKSATGQAFVLTKALLQSTAGNRDGTMEVVGWVKGVQPGSARMVLARAGSSLADCWDQYQREAIRIWTEYENCFNDTHWYNMLDRAACATLYDLQAEGAWMWYLNCVGAPIPSIRIG